MSSSQLAKVSPQGAKFSQYLLALTSGSPIHFYRIVSYSNSTAEFPMIDAKQTYYISVDELALAFMALPINSDRRLRVIGLAVSLPNGYGQGSKYQLLFDWNDTYNDWELSPTQQLVITAKHRSQ